MIDGSALALYQWLLRRSAKSAAGKVRADGLLRAAAESLKLGFIEAREAMRELRDESLVAYQPDFKGEPYMGFVSVIRVKVADAPSLERWREVLEREIADPELRELLLPAHVALEDLETPDLARVAHGLLRLPQAMVDQQPAFGFSLSARNLLGSSKLLDSIPERAKRKLGLDTLPSNPRYLVVAGPTKPRAVLLIENTTPFEDLVRLGFAQELVLVAAHGYGLNLSVDSAAGWALADALLSGRCEIINRTAGDHTLRELLNHPQTFYWGDLDAEGLRIAQALQQRIPQLRLSGLYRPMLAMARDPATSHPYSVAAGKANQLPWRTNGDELFDAMARSCVTRAVDQEAVDVARCFELASTSIDLETEELGPSLAAEGEQLPTRGNDHEA